MSFGKGENVVKEFRKRLSIEEIKSGDDGGLGRLGERLEVRGWVRTVRLQSSVTFMEVIQHTQICINFFRIHEN